MKCLENLPINTFTDSFPALEYTRYFSSSKITRTLLLFNLYTDGFLFTKLILFPQYANYSVPTSETENYFVNLSIYMQVSTFISLTLRYTIEIHAVVTYITNSLGGRTLFGYIQLKHDYLKSLERDNRIYMAW